MYFKGNNVSDFTFILMYKLSDIALEFDILDFYREGSIPDNILINVNKRIMVALKTYHVFDNRGT